MNEKSKPTGTTPSLAIGPDWHRNVTTSLSVMLGRQAPVSSSDIESIKRALLESVSKGAHGTMEPALLAESLLGAFKLLESKSPMEDQPAAPIGSLAQRLAVARQWLLTGRLHTRQMLVLGVDPWYQSPPLVERVRAAVVAALRELTDSIEKQPAQSDAARALLANRPIWTPSTDWHLAVSRELKAMLSEAVSGSADRTEVPHG